MFGAVDGQLILEVAEMINKEEKAHMEVIKANLKPFTPWDEVKVAYIASKLGRRDDAFQPAYMAAVGNGTVFGKLECQAAVGEFVDGEIEENWQGPDGFIPQRNKVVFLQASRYNSGNSWLRTSLIIDFYIHEDHENSGDTIVLPSWAPLTILDGILFEKGDILLRTMNSFYFLKAVKCNQED